MTAQAGDDRAVVTFWPVAYGFGPIGKALHLARAFRRAHGDTVRLDLVADPLFASAASPDTFDRIGPWEGPPAGGRSAVIVSVMSREGVAAARAAACPVVVVDSLAWLWDRPLDFFAHADVYAYQRLPLLPVPSRNLEGLPRARPVGAVVAPMPAVGPRDQRTGTLISLSGLVNFEFSLAGGDLWYAEGMLRQLRRSVDAGRLPDEVTVFGNAAVLDAHSDIFGDGLVAGSGRQRDFLRVAAGRDHVVVSPGLTSVVELLVLGVPFGLLPPQNFSQVKIAAALSGHGIPALDWGSPVVPWLEQAVLPEKLGGTIVRGVIADAFLRDSAFGALDAVDLIAEVRETAPSATARNLVGEPSGADEIVDITSGLVPLP